ncbi:MAG: hypothetical protein AAF670_09145 [Planctomycetota bacterium]
MTETVPKLWGTANEDAAALMRQRTGFEPGMPNVVVVECEFICSRPSNDAWGPAVPRDQEIPACTRPWNFGPHGNGNSPIPTDGPCMHLAALDRVSLGPDTVYQFRYWLVVGARELVQSRLDELDQRYAGESAQQLSSQRVSE